MRSIIVSVGTSLLTNRENETNRPWNGWSNNDPLPELSQATEYLSRAAPVLATAETHTLEKLNLLPGDRLYWLHSATAEGKFCAEALCRHYTELGNRGELRELTGLNYGESDFVDRGLRSLVSEAFKVIRAPESGTVEICATGGFKAELAFLNLVGLLSGVPVHYIHEKFKTLVTLPRLPVSWDTSLVEHNVAFFEWIEEEDRKAVEVENWLKAAPELRMLVTFEKDHGYLSPAGAALYQACKPPPVRYPEPSDRKPEEKVSLDAAEHHRPRGWRQFVDRLANIEWVEFIKYAGGSHRPSGTRAEVRDPDKGILKVIYSNDFEIHFEVTTTARGEKQCCLCADYITQNRE